VSADTPRLVDFRNGPPFSPYNPMVQWSREVADTGIDSNVIAGYASSPLQGRSQSRPLSLNRADWTEIIILYGVKAGLRNGCSLLGKEGGSGSRRFLKHALAE
jgi:hypothetical protein